MSGGFWVRGIASLIVGSLNGVMIALIVNCTLLEISLNAFFSTYFGVLFISIGSTILWRVRDGQEKQQPRDYGMSNVAGFPNIGLSTDTNPAEAADQRRRMHLQVFSYLTIASGLICFFLEGEWYFHMSRLFKIPIYSMLGVSVSLALTFSLIDAINFCVGLCQGNTMSRPIVESPNQIHTILCLAVLMGGIFGFIFGNFQVPDVNVYKLRINLLRSEFYCYAHGAVLGGIGGIVNEYLRHIEVQYSPVSLDFDDDI